MFQVEEVSAFQKKSENNTGDLTMASEHDEAFLAPEMNAFGRQFRFLFFLFFPHLYRVVLSIYLDLIDMHALYWFCRRRNYDAENERQKSVEEFYRLQHINQTVDFVRVSKLIRVYETSTVPALINGVINILDQF